MNNKQALIELATLVMDLKKCRDLYEDSGYLNAQERFEALSEKEEEVFQKAEELLAAASQPEEPAFQVFQRELKEWAGDFFRPQFGSLGKPITLADAVASFRQNRPRVTVQPFLKCLESWALESGLSYEYDTRRVAGVPKRVIIISPNPSNN